MPRILFLVIALACTLVVSAASAQRETPRARGLERRMHALLQTLKSPDGLASDTALTRFFPRQGDWSWVETITARGHEPRVRRWSFGAGDTELALAREPVCRSLGMIGVSDPDDHTLIGFARRSQWRSVGGLRFVPAGRGADFPVFVAWRREGPQWVIAALGEVREEEPALVGHEPAVFVAQIADARRIELPLADSVRVASGRPWFENSLPIDFSGHHAVKYGLPRLLHDGDVLRVGRVDGVPAYAEQPGGRDVLYLPVDRVGMFQPYMSYGGACGIVM